MNCSVCKGQLIWDYERGEIVCTKCGLIVDQLTTLEAEEYRVTAGNRDDHVVKKLKNEKRSVVSSKYKYMLKLYNECKRIVRNKPWLEIDYDKVLRTGKFVMSIHARVSTEVRKNVEILGYWDILRKGLEFIGSVNPAFLARTERSKYALAYIVARKLETGKHPSCEEVTRIFKVSTTSYKRLCVLANKLIVAADKLRVDHSLNSS
ncbi:MAG: TFIIB-type zinc ribbon-containing protein [Desulfurococcaceae archaeon]